MSNLPHVTTVGAPPDAARRRHSTLSRFARKQLFHLLHQLEEGRLRILEDGEEHRFGQSSSLNATIQVHDPSFYLSTAMRGSIGAAESYMEECWSSSDLTELIRIVARNQAILSGVEGRWSRATAPLFRLYHYLRRNTRRGSRRNIQEHYDLGNDFFSLFLDDNMMYSSAYFERPDMTLAEASMAKIDRICRKLRLKENDHLLEIGSGWGGFAIYAARHYGCRVTTTTVSDEQFEMTRKRVAAEGLQDRIRVLKEDYRDLTGLYDKLVSIEMIEAVGYEYLPVYFRKCDSLLKPGGQMLLQAITIAEEFLEEARNSVDFIKRYIFPGSALPALSQMEELVQKETSLTVDGVEDITEHYAATLRLWRRNFLDRLNSVRKLGFSDRFIRMWDYYFCYCEAGFLERHIGDYQLMLRK